MKERLRNQFFRRVLIRVGGTFCVVYLAICAFLWTIQGVFIFHPTTFNLDPEQTPIQYELDVDDSKGIKSRGYIVNATLPGPVVLFFTGNAGDAVGYVDLLAKLKVPMVLSNYRGYGTSDGSPSEKTILADAKITLAMVRKRFPDRALVVMGHSLGSAVAIRTVDSNVSGVVLISPFRSLSHVASYSVLRIFPVRLLLRHRFDTAAKLDDLPDNVLVLYSQIDKTIPVRETEQLLKRVPQADEINDDVHHNAILTANLGQIREWLQQNFGISNRTDQ